MKRYPFIVASVVALFLAGGADARAQVDRPRQFETRHYRVWADVDHELAKDLCARMDAMYDEYARRFSALASGLPGGEKLEVRIFARREDYVRYTQDRLPNSGGIFIPGRKLLAVFLEGQGRDGLRRTLQHEAFHQFAFEAIGPNVPLWLNEGIAQVFEEAIWTGRGFLIGQVPPRRVRQLREDVAQGRLIDFRRMLVMGDKDWQAGFTDRAVTGVQYNQAWAMAHFLIYASGPDGEPLHRARVIDLLRRCKAGTAPGDAFVAAFSDNIDGFQQRFAEFTRAIEPTPEAACLDNQTVLADMIVALQKRGRTFDSVEALRAELKRHDVRMHYTKGQLEWQSSEDVDEYFRDAKGQMLDARRLFFQPRRGAPLPDLVCRAIEGVQLRTRFYDNGEKIEHEVVVEPVR